MTPHLPVPDLDALTEALADVAEVGDHVCLFVNELGWGLHVGVRADREPLIDPNARPAYGWRVSTTIQPHEAYHVVAGRLLDTLAEEQARCSQHS